MFNFLEYSSAIEQIMKEWYSYSHEVLSQSTDLGYSREHFIKEVLSSFLPKSVLIGSGEIIDGDGNRSNQQDIIIYKADFPVITSLSPVNAFLAEGVIATIEIKSDLSTGEPHLHTAFKNVQKVLSLKKAAAIIHGDESAIKKLQDLTSIKTYVIGYAGWKNNDSFLNQYSLATIKTKGIVPHLVYQPGACILRNDGFINPGMADEVHKLLLNEQNPFAVFLHHLLKAIMHNTNGMHVKTIGINAEMIYYLDPYFNFQPPLPFKRLSITAK